MSKTTNKFAPEVRERAVRMVVDHERVEPGLNILARQNILRVGSAAICFSCGDDRATDYLLTNSAEAMPGVASLRLCKDCVAIRRGFGERLEAFPS